MKTIDLSGVLVIYNFVLGVLVMLSSEKIAVIAGHVSLSYETTIRRITYLSLFTFGLCTAVLSASIYVAFHLLRIGV